jgi:hypothetical protein
MYGSSLTGKPRCAGQGFKTDRLRPLEKPSSISLSLEGRGSG